MDFRLFLLVFMCVQYASLRYTCSDDFDCYSYELCVDGWCEIDRKMPGEGCVADIQCSVCCTENYVCKTQGDNSQCLYDLDTTGLVVSLVVLAITATGSIVGGCYWAKKLTLPSAS